MDPNQHHNRAGYGQAGSFPDDQLQYEQNRNFPPTGGQGGTAKGAGNPYFPPTSNQGGTTASTGGVFPDTGGQGGTTTGTSGGVFPDTGGQGSTTTGAGGAFPHTGGHQGGVNTGTGGRRDVYDDGDNFGSDAPNFRGAPGPAVPGGGNPSVSDKFVGNVEKAAGRVTGSTNMTERGQMRKTGGPQANDTLL
ncbi:hypothetical protein C8Q78DRAFT_1079759 [Trametes maxima]|nr:hypothetical protein C8Q78DRAFT_1079759 [Trametes maxima]